MPLLASSYPPRDNPQAFVSDPKGNSVFIGVSPLCCNPSIGPFYALPGDNKRPMINSNFQIGIDDQGNFTGVRQNEVDFTIEQWNKQYESQSPR